MADVEETRKKRGLDDLKRAQERVEALRREGVAPTDRAFTAAMNRLMSLVRHASPEDVAAFDAWRLKSQ